MNQLSKEQSPYLLQHAQQPVNWFAWGKEAFDRAKSDDKPILLSIGYATCHWCHVMAHESFDDPDVAKILNEYFISIKVDREERPDIDHVYMTAVSAMSGSGGWPLNVFLMPDGKPFYGGTYFPPEPRWGMMSFKDLLLSLHDAWLNNRSQLLNSSQELISSISSYMATTLANDKVIDEALLTRAYNFLEGDYDQVNGGFGQQPKFPMGHTLWFLLRYHYITKNMKSWEMVEHALTAMANGGIWDHLGGGFHRYSVDGHWHVPHFEKMLYDQAILLRSYTEAYQVSGNLFFAQIARDIADYVLRDMTHPQGGFYSAEDADSLDHNGHHTEGAFYVFAQMEIDSLLNDQQARIFNAAFGVAVDGNVSHDPQGEFTGKNILYRAKSDDQLAAMFSLSVDDVRESLARSKEILLQVRNERPRPLCDDKILVDLNGLMIASLSFAANVFQEPVYAKAARKSADFIWDSLMVDGRLMHRWRNGHVAHAATLDDYAYLAFGFIELYQTSFDGRDHERVEILMKSMVDLFADPQGGFFMNAADQSDLPMRPKDLGDGATPSGNSITAMVLVKLWALSGEEQYRDLFERLFRAYTANLHRNPSALPAMWCAWMQINHGGGEVLLHGDLENVEIAKMKKVLYKDFRPFVVVRATQGEGIPCAYICRQRVCLMPVTTVEAFSSALGD